MRKLTKNLRDNSVETFILALETINRPSVKYRTESFCVLFCNAWELLMKARLLDQGKKIFHRKKRSQNRKSLSLDECLNAMPFVDNDPIKLNIKKISEMRNDAVHLAIPFVPPDIMGLFQAGVTNYTKKLQEWLGVNLSHQMPVNIAPVYDFNAKEPSLAGMKTGKKLPSNVKKWLTHYQDEIRSQATALGDRASQYYIPIDANSATVKSPDRGDIVPGSKRSARLKGAAKTHPYRITAVKNAVNAALGGSPSLNLFDLLSIRAVHKIDASKPEYYFKPKYTVAKYSQKYVDWLIGQAKKDSEFFSKARESFKAVRSGYATPPAPSSAAPTASSAPRGG